MPESRDGLSPLPLHVRIVIFNEKGEPDGVVWQRLADFAEPRHRPAAAAIEIVEEPFVLPVERLRVLLDDDSDETLFVVLLILLELLWDLGTRLDPESQKAA